MAIAMLKVGRRNRFPQFLNYVRTPYKTVEKGGHDFTHNFYGLLSKETVEMVRKVMRTLFYVLIARANINSVPITSQWN